MIFMAYTLVFSHASEHPAENLHLFRHDIANPGPTEVLVKMLAAPVNPLDLMVLKRQIPCEASEHRAKPDDPGL